MLLRFPRVPPAGEFDYAGVRRYLLGRELRGGRDDRVPAPEDVSGVVTGQRMRITTAMMATTTRMMRTTVSVSDMGLSFGQVFAHPSPSSSGASLRG